MQELSYANLRRITMAAFASFSFASAAAIAPANANEPLTGRVSVDRPLVVRGGDRVVYVLVNFDAFEEDRRGAWRPPLNLSMVLDRSGSMSDAGKMDYLQRAAKMAVDRLSREDTLSIVEFDDKVTVMWPAQSVRDTRELKTLIDELSPRGSTNLTGGLLQGVDEVDAARREIARNEGTINRVMLMSDGLANVGITDPGRIRELVRDARRKGIRISTMGLGRDYDEDLMQDVAEAGGGRYYYIEHPAQMARIFEEELSTMFRTTARDCEFYFDGSSAVRRVEIVGFDGKSGNDLRQGLEDFYAGEKRAVLLRLEVAANAAGTLDLGELRLSYKNAANGGSAIFAKRVSVEVTTDEAASDRALDRTVTVEATLAETERKQKEQVKLFESGRRDEATRNLAVISKDLEAKNAAWKDPRVKKKIEALSVENRQMTAAASPEAQSSYLKASKNRLYQAKQGKRALQQMQLGDKGMEVERLQESLKKQGYYSGPVDGVYDADVKRAVESYQNAKGVENDGVAGAATMDALGMY